MADTPLTGSDLVKDLGIANAVEAIPDDEPINFDDLGEAALTDSYNNLDAFENALGVFDENPAEYMAEHGLENNRQNRQLERNNLVAGRNATRENVRMVERNFRHNLGAYIDQNGLLAEVARNSGRYGERDLRRMEDRVRRQAAGLQATGAIQSRRPLESTSGNQMAGGWRNTNRRGAGGGAAPGR